MNRRGWRSGGTLWRRPKLKPARVDGYLFNSLGEAERYLALKARAAHLVFDGPSDPPGSLIFKFRLTANGRWDVESFRAKVPRPNKFGAKTMHVDGIKFHSRREARHYVRLKPRVTSGQLIDFRRQVEYPLVVNGQLVCTYIADFEYIVAATGEAPVVDAKGWVTPEFRLKQKLFRAIYQFDIEVV